MAALDRPTATAAAVLTGSSHNRLRATAAVRMAEAASSLTAEVAAARLTRNQDPATAAATVVEITAAPARPTDRPRTTVAAPLGAAAVTGASEADHQHRTTAAAPSEVVAADPQVAVAAEEASEGVTLAAVAEIPVVDIPVAAVAATREAAVAVITANQTIVSIQRVPSAAPATLTGLERHFLSVGIHRDLRVTQTAAWLMLHRIRLAMQSRPANGKESSHSSLDNV